MSDNLFHAVAIFDAVPMDELQTARRLREDLRDLAMAFSPTPEILYFRIENHQQFIDAIRDLHRMVVSRGAFPLLHFEGHGSETGLFAANRDQVSWLELKNELIPLNEAMRLNLMLVLGACYGATFISAMQTVERAPVGGIIGPTGEVEAGDVQASFGSFYGAIFRGEGASAAITALNTSNAGYRYYRTSAQEFFLKVWCQYQKHYVSKSKLQERARQMRKKAKREGQLINVPSIGKLKRRLKSSEQHYFEKYRDTYFMFDLYPENRKRFQITYSQAMARCH